MFKSCVSLFVATLMATVSPDANVPQNSTQSRRDQMQKDESNNLISDANNVSITVVYDNNPYKEGLGTSWGFSCVIKGTEKTILFDTGGDGELLLENMSKTGIDVNSIETVVFSHIHADHTGGLERFLEKNPKVSVYVPKSFPKRFKQSITSSAAALAEVDKKTQVCKGVYSTGQMGKLIKEQGLVLRTDKGLAVITGCAHPGIFKMVKRASDLFDEQVLLVMGGFHLEWATKVRTENIIKGLEDMNVKYAGPCHCSGEKARSLFAEHFGDNFINIGVGKVLKLKDLR